MNESTIGENSQWKRRSPPMCRRKENGQVDAARQMLRDHLGLAEEVATYYALCARVPKPGLQWSIPTMAERSATSSCCTSWAAAAKAWFTRHGKNRCKPWWPSR